MLSNGSSKCCKPGKLKNVLAVLGNHFGSRASIQNAQKVISTICRKIRKTCITALNLSYFFWVFANSILLSDHKGLYNQEISLKKQQYEIVVALKNQCLCAADPDFPSGSCILLRPALQVLSREKCVITTNDILPMTPSLSYALPDILKNRQTKKVKHCRRISIFVKSDGKLSCLTTW